MIICNSNNFAVTRAQKTGGTSLEMYILESGLVDYEKDEYTLEGGFANWEEFKAYSEQHENLKYSDLPEELYGDSLFDAQKTFFSLVEQGKISENFPCIGGIRHPLEWLASLFYYANVRRKIVANKHLKETGAFTSTDIEIAKHFSEPNASWDFVFEMQWHTQHIQENLKAQTSYYPDHARLFNIENIHEHVSAFIAEKGGISPSKKIEIRKSENDPTYYLSNLSDDRKQRALEIYEKDLIAWEKAYAVYN